MKSFFHKTLSIFMAILVLFTTMSFTVDMHYCGETLVDFSLTQNAQTCGMEAEKKTEDCHKVMTEKSCCTDKQLVVEGKDDLKLSIDTLNFDQQVFVASFFYTYINLFEGLDTNVIPFRDYKPPLLTRDIQKLHESYLL